MSTQFNFKSHGSEYNVSQNRVKVTDLINRLNEEKKINVVKIEGFIPNAVTKTKPCSNPNNLRNTGYLSIVENNIILYNLSNKYNPNYQQLLDYLMVPLILSEHYYQDQ